MVCGGVRRQGAVVRERCAVPLRTAPTSHSWPAVQMVHAVRVVGSPPSVKEPGSHTVQFAAPAALNLLSVPHGVTALPP